VAVVVVTPGTVVVVTPGTVVVVTFLTGAIVDAAMMFSCVEVVISDGRPGSRLVSVLGLSVTFVTSVSVATTSAALTTATRGRRHVTPVHVNVDGLRQRPHAAPQCGHVLLKPPQRTRAMKGRRAVIR
jgi:hypothetical protein